MNRVSTLLAWRYLLGTQLEKNISTMVRICFLGILIGSFSLALVSAVMHGFETTIHEKMQSIHAQLIIRARGQELDTQAIATVIKNEFPEIIGFSPSNIQYAIIPANDEDQIPIVTVLKGIDPVREATTSALEQKIISRLEHQQTLDSLVHNNRILMGSKLAKDLEVSIGDKIELLYTDYQDTYGHKINLEKTHAIIGGIFQTGIDEFDSNMIIAHLDFVRSLFNEGATQINVKLASGIPEQPTINNLKNRLGIDVYSWKDLYPALISALKLEKYVMFFILALITLVASMNIISLLFMQITQKRAEIAILKAMGASDNIITRIFIFLGMFITTLGTSLGLVLAAFVSWLLNKYPFIQLPDAYYVSHLPAHLDWHIIMTVLVVVLSLGFIATWIPTRKTRTINIAHVLRFEG